MHEVQNPLVVPIAWGVVAIGMFTLAVFVHRFPASNRTQEWPSSKLVGLLFAVCGIAAVVRALLLTWPISSLG